MHSVDVLEEALTLAMNSGVQVRQEWLQERGGGMCRVGQDWILFVDLSLTAQEQLEQVVQALREWGKCRIDASCSPQLERMLQA